MTEDKCETVSNEAVPNETGTVDPKDVFRNRFTYLCYELYHYHVSPYWYLSSCISIMTVMLCFHYGAEDGRIFALGIISTFISAFICVLLLSIFVDFFHQEFYTSSQLKLCKEVITNKPVLNMKSWSKISQNMNKLLYEKGEWPTPYFFYDGRSCYNFFNSNIVEKYSGIPNSSTDQDTNDSAIVGNSIQNTTTPVKNTDPVEEEPIENYYRKARAIHLQSINDYNRAQYAEFNL